MIFYIDGDAMFERFVLLMTGCFLTSCAVQRAVVAQSAQAKMVGLSKEQVLACMAPPAQKMAEGVTEVWSYSSGNDRGPTGGLLTGGDQCAFAVENCTR